MKIIKFEVIESSNFIIIKVSLMSTALNIFTCILYSDRNKNVFACLNLLFYIFLVIKWYNKNI